MALFLLFLNKTILRYVFMTFVAWLLFRFCRFIYQVCFRKRMNFKERYGKKTWVLVTGATDGLGRAFSDEFAREGFNIILVSRSEEKLKKVANEILAQNKDIKVHTITFDFNEKRNLDDYKSAFGNLLESFDISILVNNVGFWTMGNFSDISMEDHHRLINVNIIPQTFLTKLLADPMAKRNKRSAVIDLSSFLSSFPFPQMATYSATKSFNYFLSRALAEEYQNNIDFLSVRLLAADTPMSQLKANGYGVITPKQVINGTLLDLGYEKETYGHWIHKVQAFLLNLIPKFLMYPLLRITNPTKKLIKKTH